jgi:hypothetical protein
MKPYYQDEWVTIYHLTFLPICDNLLLDDCTEVASCCVVKNELGGIEQENGERMFRNLVQVLKRVISKAPNMYRNVNGLVQNIIIGRARISLSSLVVLGHYVSTQLDHVNCVATLKQRGIIKTVTLEIINPIMSNSFAVDVICPRMVD